MNLKIKELETYLKCLREDVNYMTVGEVPVVPNNLCEKHDKDAIIIYGVTEEQLP